MAISSFPVHTLLISICKWFSPNAINKSNRKSSRDLSEPWHTRRILTVWYARQTELISPCSDISLALFLPNCLRSLKFEFSPHPFSAFKKHPEVTTGIEQKGKKSPPREAHACSCTAHARSDSKYNVYFVTKGYSFRVCRCYCEATEHFCGTIFWVNTTKTRIMDARPFRGRIVLLGWEDYRNLINPFTLTPK